MNFKEICESVLDEADGRAVQLDSVALGRDTAGDLYLDEATHRNVVMWVAAEYKRIQLLSPFWDFHHKRGTLLTLRADIESYKKTGVRDYDRDSFYFLSSSGTAHYPLNVRQYDWWQQHERTGDVSSSTVPTDLIDAPGDEWILWPTPSAAGTVEGDWWVEPFELINASDEPCWDERYHSLLKWGVLAMYAAEFVSEKSASKLIPRVRQMLPALQIAFERDYLPHTRGAPTLF